MEDDRIFPPPTQERLLELLRRHPYGKTAKDWKLIAMEHWRLYRPKWAYSMNEATLEYLAQEAGRKTYREIMELVRSGLRYHEAEEMVREKYVLVRPEESEEDEEPEEGEEEM